MNQMMVTNENGTLVPFPVAAVLLDWISKLESGEYEQGSTVLRGIDEEVSGHCRYCVLGVLCEAMVEAGVMQRRLVHGIWEYAPFTEGCATSWSSVLVESVNELFRLPDGTVAMFDCLGREDCKLSEFADLNDAEGIGFDEFAIMLREQLLPYFPTVH